MHEDSFSRRKLKNCIRKDTYRYILNEKYAVSVWNNIELIYGNAVKNESIGLLTLENEKFKIVKSINDNSFTLIHKKCFSQDDEKQLHIAMRINE